MSASRRKPGPLGPFVEGYRAGLIRSRLPALATILGHRDPSYTYYYLSAAPALLACAAGLLDIAQEAQS